jgi:hypothetical protein
LSFPDREYVHRYKVSGRSYVEITELPVKGEREEVIGIVCVKSVKHVGTG